MEDTMEKQQYIANIQERHAMEFYHSRYVNRVYQIAIQGKNNRYANKLLDDAMAICGSPYYKLSHVPWGCNSIAFLSLFLKE
jgi:hypothetical protein